MTTTTAQPASASVPTSRSLTIVPDEWHWKKGRWIFWGIAAAIFAVGVILSFFPQDFGTPREPEIWSLGFPFLLFPALALIGSIFTTGTTEEMTITAFGKAVIVLKPGFGFGAWPYLRRQRWPMHSIEEESPAKGDRIFWGDEEEPLPEGMVRPNRAMPKSTEDPMPNHPLDSAMPIAHSEFFRFRILNPFGFKAAFRTIQEAIRQLRDMARSEVDDEISKRTTKQAMEDREAFHVALETALQDLVGDTAKIEMARMFSPNLGHKTSAKLAGIVQARADAIAEEARGKGKGKATEAELTGRAKGIEALKAAGVDPVIAEAADAMKATFAKTDKLVVSGDSGVTGVTSMAITVANALKAGTANSTRSTP